MANWSDREIEAAIEATFTKFRYPAASPEQMEAVKEFVKGKDVFVSLRRAAESPFATVVCHMCSTLCGAEASKRLSLLSLAP